jgi:hypothetical protein
MANEIEQNNLSFGITDTVQMGMGNQELLDDILSPETSTAKPEDIKDINAPDDKPVAKPAAAPKKEDKEEKEEEEGGLDDFLNSEEEEEEDAPVKKPAAKVAAKEEEEDEGAPAPDAEEDDAQSGTQFEALSNDLFELGVFSKEADEEIDPIKTPEAFLERFNVEKKKGAMEMVDNFIGQFGQDYQDAFDAIYVKGLNPQEYFKTAGKIENFSKLDLSVESNQERVVRQALTDQGFEAEDVDAEITKLKNYGDLEVTSQRHHKVLIKKETAALAAKTEQAQADQAQKAQWKQQYVDNVNNVLQEKIKEKEFDGIPLNPKIANELQDFLLVDKWKTESGETLTDFDRYMLELKRPENHANKVKVALLLKILEKDPTLSTIQKSGVTKKSNTLFKEVSRQVSKSPSNKTSGAKSWFK